jgi:hypothetical protein
MKIRSILSNSFQKTSLFVASFVLISFLTAGAQDQVASSTKKPAVTAPTGSGLVSVNAIAVNNSKIQISWTTQQHTEFQYFILQRSEDGIQFKDVMMLMTDTEGTFTTNQYKFKDDISKLTTTSFFYQLQMVDKAGNIHTSAVFTSASTMNDVLASK